MGGSDSKPTETVVGLKHLHYHGYKPPKLIDKSNYDVISRS